VHNSQNKKTLQIVLIVLVAVLTLGIGYAAISAVNLIINGNATANPSDTNFKVKFLKETGVTPKITSEYGGTGDIDVTSDTTATFNITGLDAVGESAVANFKVKNESNNVGAEISLSVTNSNSEYFKVTETIQDNKLQAGEETTATVKVEMIKTPINNAVTTSITATLIATPLENDSATGGSPASKVAGEPESFSTDSWATIQKAVQNNNTSVYNVGDTKSVTINGTEYRVRIANKSTAQNCSDTNYSETACGFVVEFVDIVEQRAMNTENTNVGGWPATEMRTYLNGTFYNSLPSDLQAAIKPTRVISGHGSNDADNFTSTDNLYLLSGVEVFGSDDYDTAAGTTHQLEFYQGMEADAKTPWGAQAYSRTYKGYNGSDGSTEYWWLRPAYSNGSDDFRDVAYGYLGGDSADYTHYGLAPAFRIG